MTSDLNSNSTAPLIDTVVIDAGARYGLHPSWSELRGIVDFHLFEMDINEANRLKNKYRNDAHISVYPIALYSDNRTLKYQVRAHEAMNSIYMTNTALLDRDDYKQNEFVVTKEMVVEARTIDSMFRGRDVHFLKLDVEGAELEVLEGARGQLRSSVLAVRCEVLFAPIFDGAPLFGDIHKVLLREGLDLVNFDYTGGGNKYGRFTLPGRYGKVLSTDAVWVVSNERLFATKGEQLAKIVIRLALFLMLNGATDLAVDLLERVSTREGISLEKYYTDPLFVVLHRKVLLLFKALLDFPMFTNKDITSVYKTIFRREFPLMNQFYQSELFT